MIVNFVLLWQNSWEKQSYGSKIYFVFWFQRFGPLLASCIAAGLRASRSLTRGGRVWGRLLASRRPGSGWESQSYCVRRLLLSPRLCATQDSTLLVGAATFRVVSPISLLSHMPVCLEGSPGTPRGALPASSVFPSSIRLTLTWSQQFISIYWTTEQI